jgi:hypothetical protein
VAWVPYVIDVPWSEVVEIRERVRPPRGSAAMLIALSTLTFATFGLVVLAVPTEHVTGGATTKWLLGGALLGTTLAFDIPLLPTAFAPDKDVVLFGERSKDAR